jgi:hypothetical protein
MAGTAQAQDIFHEHADGKIMKGGTVCVGPLSPTDDDGVHVVGSTAGPASLNWQVWSTSSQTAPAIVFSSIGTGVNHVVPPDGNFLFYACATRAPRVAQDFDLTLNSGTVGAPAVADIEQQHSFGTILKGMTVCTGDVAPSDATGVQIVGFQNGCVAQPATWRVVSVDDAGVPVVELSQTATSVDRTVVPDDGLVYHACVVKGPSVALDYDLTLNSTTLE